LLFSGVTEEGRSQIITEDIESIQLVKPKDWWTNKLERAGFGSVNWVTNCICLATKHPM